MRDRSGVLTFTNQRAAAWWALRDALDPAHGSAVALPPSRELRAELTATRYEKQASGIKLEDKDETRKRIGRSPDVGDAVVMAHAYWLVGRGPMRSYPVRLGGSVTQQENAADRLRRMPNPVPVRPLPQRGWGRG
jgi:hypothetical protein